MPTYERRDGDDVVERVTTGSGSLEDSRLRKATKAESGWSVSDDEPDSAAEPEPEPETAAPTGRAPRGPHSARRAGQADGASTGESSGEG